jgi:aminoglycoside 3-N-acetyltransferase I
MEVEQLGRTAISDFINLIEIFNDVFENVGQIPDSEYLSRLLSNPDFKVFVAKIEGKVVGGLTVYILPQYYGTKPAAYIYDVGVTPPFQGQGLGKALIAEVCQYCAANGFADAYVAAESDDIDAVSFYRKTMFSNELSAIHFTYTFADRG